MDWRPVQGVHRLSPDDRWDRLQPPRDPTDGLDGIEHGWNTQQGREEDRTLNLSHTLKAGYCSSTVWIWCIQQNLVFLGGYDSDSMIKRLAKLMLLTKVKAHLPLNKSERVIHAISPFC